MIRILFICHGNICRSPMAEYIFRDMVEKAGLAGDFRIASAATSYEELGNPVYPPAKRLLAARGIRCDGKRAYRMNRADYDAYDLLICMDGRPMQMAMFGARQGRILRPTRDICQASRCLCRERAFT